MICEEWGSWKVLWLAQLGRVMEAWHKIHDSLRVSGETSRASIDRYVVAIDQ